MRGNLLVAAQAGVSISVIDGVAKRELGRLESLEEEANLLFVGHPNSAVNLDGFSSDQIRDIGAGRRTNATPEQVALIADYSDAELRAIADFASRIRDDAVHQ